MISHIKRYTFLVGIVKLLREKTSDGNVFLKNIHAHMVTRGEKQHLLSKTHVERYFRCI